MDSRIEKLANVLVHYSVALKKGQLVKIAGETAGLPLIKAVFKEAVKVGAHPVVQIRVSDNEETMMKFGSDAQLKYLPPMAKLEIKKIDAYIGIWGSENTRNLSGVDPKRQALYRLSTK